MTQEQENLTFDRDLDAPAGTVRQISPLVRRVVCDNPGPFTFTGTCTYIIGRGQVSIIDPGPADPRHVAALLKAVEGETIANILVTHTHRDHSPAASMVKAATGARILGCESHVRMHFSTGAANPMDASFDS
jgi:glyoxylase-like metal-dependent hydrolase (beta-lactamase superfamily II)